LKSSVCELQSDNAMSTISFSVASIYCAWHWVAASSTKTQNLGIFDVCFRLNNKNE